MAKIVTRKQQPGWVETSRGQVKPFMNYRQISKGKNKGKFEVEVRIYTTKKIIVPASNIRSFPIRVKAQAEMNQLDGSYTDPITSMISDADQWAKA